MKRSLVVLLALVVLLPACETLPWQKKAPPPEVAELEPLEPDAAPEGLPATGPGLLPATEHRFKDIPLPAEVKEDLDRTFVFRSATLEVGRMVYTSKAGMNELAQFYLNECPAADWRLENVLQAESVTLLFTKPDKRLDVTVRDLGVPRGRLLVLLLTPDAGTGAQQ